MFIAKLKNSKWLRWDEGRQQSGYKKMLLLTGHFPLPFDFYFLKFEEGSSIPEHIDPAKSGYKHYRMNIILKKSISGGEFISEKNILDFQRLKFFRPDLYKHSVTEVKGGSRFVLSFGFLIKS